MTTIKEKKHSEEKLQALGTLINDQAGQIQKSRNGLTDDIRNLIKSANRADARLMLRELSEAIVEINGRADRLKFYIKDLENLRDKIAKSIPEKLKS